MQFVSCCAIAARLQKAVATSKADSFLHARAESRVLTEYDSVILISAEDRISHARGMYKTFWGPYSRRGGSFGSNPLEIRHCLGICDSRYSCLRLAMDFQGASTVVELDILQIILYQSRETVISSSSRVPPRGRFYSPRFPQPVSHILDEDRCAWALLMLDRSGMNVPQPRVSFDRCQTLLRKDLCLDLSHKALALSTHLSA